MGAHRNISFDRFPTQSDRVGKRVEVVFHFDVSRRVHGTVVRDDTEHPHRMIIILDDNRLILADECQWRPL